VATAVPPEDTVVAELVAPLLVALAAVPPLSTPELLGAVLEPLVALAAGVVPDTATPPPMVRTSVSPG